MPQNKFTRDDYDIVCGHVPAAAATQCCTQNAAAEPKGKGGRTSASSRQALEARSIKSFVRFNVFCDNVISFIIGLSIRRTRSQYLLRPVVYGYPTIGSSFNSLGKTLLNFNQRRSCFFIDGTEEPTPCPTLKAILCASKPFHITNPEACHLAQLSCMFKS